ncbi:MAG: PrsW family intramembrane metalloprotease [Bacteroidaceae bacterium]|nr:PrsW family intramembrane metalloprotease [Bacteroidaceae bacterium]
MIILTAALLPAILLWMYIWKKDPQKEPTSLLVKATVLGVLISIPVSFVELNINSMLFGSDGGPTTLMGASFQAFFVAAIPEESFKLLVLWLVLRKNPFFDEHFDGIVYAVCVGLGFAAIENVMYVFTNEAWLYVAISRALLAVPGHYAFAVIMGYYYSIYKFVDHSSKAATRVILMPVLAHGIYDTLAMSANVNPYIGGLCFFVLIYFCIKLHKVAKKKIVALTARDTEEITNEI